MSEYCVALVTAPDKEVAADIAGKLVTEGLAACCNVIPGVRSIYTWKGEVCNDAEVLCVYKTTRELFERFTRRVVELHPYDVPEVVSLDIDQGHAPYLNWISEVTGEKGKA